MSNNPSNSQTVHWWLDTLAAGFDPTQTFVPPSRSTHEQPAMPPNDPRVKLEEAIGQGGMSTVHRGRQLSLDREIAIKIKRADLDSSTLDILHEAWLTSALEHPNIVPIYDLSLDEAGDPMVLMRRIEGTEWGKLFNKPEIVMRDYGVTDPMDWHLRVFLQVCSAIHYAHSMGIIHRDIKPANVMVGVHGQVYLLDWGIAMGKRGPLANKLNKLRTNTEPAGTPCYLAPEMLTGDTEPVDERTDVYLLGATLYHLVTGKPPHCGETLEEVLDSVVNNRVDIPDDLPSEVQVILRKALAREPDERFSDAATLRRAIDSYLSHRSSYELEQHALEHQEALQEALASRQLDNPQDRAELYKLYSSCRSGYRAALQLWKKNPTALAGLELATTRMINAEIAHGTPRAATALLSEIENPSDELVCRVSDAQHTEGAEHDDMLQMASIVRNWSRQSGARLRVALIITIGFFYGAYSAFVPSYSYRSFMIADVVGLIGIGAYAIFMRRSGQLNAFNSRAVVILILVLSVQLLRRVLAIATDMPTEVVLVHDGLVFMNTMLVAAVVLESRLWPSCIMYGIAHVLALIDVSYAGASLGLAHAFMALNTAWIWWPRRMSPEAALPERDRSLAI